MSTVKRGADGFYALRLTRLMQLPFKRWHAYEIGLIDQDGNKLRDPETTKEKASWTLFHIAVRNLKMLIHKIPGGQTLLNYGASYALLFEVKQEFGLSDEFMNAVNEAVTVGDSGGDVNNIASGEMSGAITLPPPDVLGNPDYPKKKKKRVSRFRNFDPKKTKSEE